METKTIEVDLIEHTAEEPITEENSLILNGYTNTLPEEENPVEIDSDELYRDLYLRQIEDYCNVTFDSENIPSGIMLALNELVKTDPSRYNIASEKIADLSITYNNNSSGSGGLPAYIRGWVDPYRRPHLVGNKMKRPYIDGRK